MTSEPDQKPVIDRLDAIEAAAKRVLADIADIRATQVRVVDQQAVMLTTISRGREDTRRELHEEAKRLRDDLFSQAQSLIRISNSLMTLRNEVSRWAAGGSLLGAVILFIAVRALGF